MTQTRINKQLVLLTIPIRWSVRNGHKKQQIGVHVVMIYPKKQRTVVAKKNVSVKAGISLITWNNCLFLACIMFGTWYFVSFTKQWCFGSQIFFCCLLDMLCGVNLKSVCWYLSDDIQHGYLPYHVLNPKSYYLTLILLNKCKSK